MLIASSIRDVRGAEETNALELVATLGKGRPVPGIVEQV